MGGNSLGQSGNSQGRSGSSLGRSGSSLGRSGSRRVEAEEWKETGKEQQQVPVCMKGERASYISPRAKELAS